MSAPNPLSTTASDPTPKPSSNSRPRFRLSFQQTRVAQATGTNPNPGHHVTCHPSSVPPAPTTHRPPYPRWTRRATRPGTPTMNTHQPTATQSTFIDPDPSPLAPAVPETCDIPRQSEIFTNTHTPNKHLAPPPSSPRLCPMPDTHLAQARILRVESETSAPPSRAVLCPDTRREILNPEKRPDRIESPGISSPHPLSSIPDTLPSKICDNTGQCETSAAASPAHLPVSDLQPPTSNSQLLTSTSPPRRTCDNTGQSETFADTRTSNMHIASAPASPRLIPDTLLSETHEICVESGTFIDVSCRNLNHEPRDATDVRPLNPIPCPRSLSSVPRPPSPQGRTEAPNNGMT